MQRRYIFFILLCLLCGCKGTSDRHDATAPNNGIYYWRTTFCLSAAEQQFMTDHHVKRLYLRLFDVEMPEPDLWGQTQPQPVATLLFQDKDNLSTSMGLIDECIPTVFITLDALKYMQGREAEYAKKVVTRVFNMCTYHGFSNKVHEVQIDCDWTSTTEDTYFHLLTLIRKELREKGCRLSATIRLHQLKTMPPPVDRGVLMLYNTGSFRLPDTDNSILTYASAAQYLRGFSYPLRLDYAFPVFSWGVWFRDDKFMAILHEQNFSDTIRYQCVETQSKVDSQKSKAFPNAEDAQHRQNILSCSSASQHYVVLEDHTADGHLLKQGDVIRYETADLQAIEQLKQLLPLNQTSNIILYHLDEKHLNKLSHYEAETLYSRPARK